ncbi:LPS export ABC transporter periplasmic protein LptC [Parasulfuritortus cantonensis]|nr:LPS export ABC transporter periplasmic protein LptC [Parasulfuritortus cantonensis]
MTDGPFQQASHFWLPLVIVGGLVVLTTWLGQLAEQPLPQAPTVLRHDPDYFVENFNATAYDVSGQPRYHLTAVRLTHYMDDDTADLIAPRFVREGAGVARVVVRSLRGVVSANGDTVDFIGDVRMLRERLQDGPPIDLTTDYLRAYPDRDLVVTNKPVLIKDGGGQLRGAAMQADGKQKTLELSGRVKGIYETRH